MWVTLKQKNHFFLQSFNHTNQGSDNPDLSQKWNKNPQIGKINTGDKYN